MNEAHACAGHRRWTDADLQPAPARHAVRDARGVRREPRVRRHAGLCRGGSRDRQRRARRGGQVRRRGDLPAQYFRGYGGLPARRGHARGDAAPGLQGSLPPVCGRGLACAVLRSRVRRAGAACRGQPVLLRDAELGQPGLDHVPRPEPRCLRGPVRARNRMAEDDLSAPAGERSVDGHHVSDRAALRHRSGAAADQGRAAGRRQLPHHRQQDLHQRGRARHGGEHRAPGAGPPARRACGEQGHQPVRSAQVPGEHRWLAGSAQRHFLHVA